MIFTACALVAERYGVGLQNLKNLGYGPFHTAIQDKLSKSLEDSKKQNTKIGILVEEYSDIKMNTTDNQKAINDFIDWVTEISECVNSNEWRGEDVMGIFLMSSTVTRKSRKQVKYLRQSISQILCIKYLMCIKKITFWMRHVAPVDSL